MIDVAAPLTVCIFVQNHHSTDAECLCRECGTNEFHPATLRTGNSRRTVELFFRCFYLHRDSRFPRLHCVGHVVHFKVHSGGGRARRSPPQPAGAQRSRGSSEQGNWALKIPAIWRAIELRNPPQLLSSFLGSSSIPPLRRGRGGGGAVKGSYQ